MENKQIRGKKSGINHRNAYRGELCVDLRPEDERVLARLTFETGLSKTEIVRKGLGVMSLIHDYGLSNDI